MRVLICGDRNWNDYAAVREVVATFPLDTVVIEGEARGADSMARDAANERGLTVIGVPALWERFGRAAGPIRNRAMLTHCHPDLVIYFHHNLAASKGTRDMTELARKGGLQVFSWTAWLQRLYV